MRESPGLQTQNDGLADFP